MEQLKAKNPSNGDEDVIRLREFQLQWIMLDSVICLVGRRRSGKSWAIRCIMHYLSQRGVPYGKIYSGTEHCNPFFQTFFPALFIDNKFTDKDLAEIMQSQKHLVKKVRKKYKVQDGRRLSNCMALIFDDMLSEADTWRKSKHFTKLFVEGRHYNILFIMALQHVMGIPPGLRDNIDFAFLFANDGSNLEKLWKNYAGVIPTFDMFKKIFYACTRDKGCMVINKTSSSENLSDKVFFFKAYDPGRFKFGTAEFWALHDQTYLSSDDESDGEHARKKTKNLIETYGTNGQKYKISIG